MAAIVWMCALAAAAAPGADVVVVCPRSFREALQPWVAHRTAQGYLIEFVSNSGGAESIRASIRRAARGGSLRYVLLVGDADPAAAWDERVRARSVPTHKASAKVAIRWGSEPEIASDNWYADLDDDQAPDLAIGRLPADSPEELAGMVRKILAYESAAGDARWRRRIQFVAGVGGFGPLVDYVVETVAKRLLCEGIPAGYEMTMTYGSWRSPYCPDPRRFHEAVVRRWSEGCLFWIYIGHGQRSGLDYVRVPGGQFPILDASEAGELDCRRGRPIAIFLACYTGAFDQPRDCLAEELLRAPGGPVAVLASSRVTMPYAMAVMGDALMDEAFRRRRATIGEVVLHAKRRLAGVEQDAEPPESAPMSTRRLADALASALSPDPDNLPAERQEHVLLFNLLGDPLLRLPVPRSVALHVSAQADAGSALEISGASPIAGPCRIELVCRRDRTRVAPPERRRFDPLDAALAAYDETYRQANLRQWAAIDFVAPAGSFHAPLAIPRQAQGPCVVRAFVQDNRGAEYALGSAPIYVRPVRVADAGGAPQLRRTPLPAGRADNEAAGRQTPSLRQRETEDAARRSTVAQKSSSRSPRRRRSDR